MFVNLKNKIIDMLEMQTSKIKLADKAGVNHNDRIDTNLINVYIENRCNCRCVINQVLCDCIKFVTIANFFE